MKQIHLTIDGTPIVATQGQTILEVARENDIHIPTLCFLEKLKPLGSCRMCVVEVEGTPTPVTACTTQAGDKMVVTTHSSFLESMRRETLKLLFQQHPMNCAACDINGTCQLQDLAYQYDIGHNDLHTYNIQPIEFEATPWATPLIQYHPRRCILCGRCVQACVQVSEVGAINFKGRGAGTRIAPVEPTAEFQPECASCGECLAVCPVNALTPAMGKPQGKPWETDKVKTVCSYCGCGCELELHVVKNQLVAVTGSIDGVNRGELCTKGRFGFDFVNHRDRLTDPLIRRGDRWEVVNWDVALEYVADRLAQIHTDHGPDAIAALSSARCTNEENYLLQKLMRGVLGTNNVDHCARL